MSTCLNDVATAVVAVVEPDTQALLAAQLMRKHHVGALVVVDAVEKARPVGIVTDRDLVLALMAEGLDPALFTVGDIMSIALVTARPDTDVLDAVALMRDHRLRRLVVVDATGLLVGIVSLDDLLAVMSQRLLDLTQVMSRSRDREFEQRA
ncbi:MAG: CBS domain-containing protein [Burkholderiales bacterium]|nr:CBS domain-containing protein [Burkholderiales bacterium]